MIVDRNLNCKCGNKKAFITSSHPVMQNVYTLHFNCIICKTQVGVIDVKSEDVDKVKNKLKEDFCK